MRLCSQSCAGQCNDEHRASLVNVTSKITAAGAPSDLKKSDLTGSRIFIGEILNQRDDIAHYILFANTASSCKEVDFWLTIDRDDAEGWLFVLARSLLSNQHVSYVARHNLSDLNTYLLSIVESRFVNPLQECAFSH
jgi:hypothetical protein